MGGPIVKYWKGGAGSRRRGYLGGRGEGGASPGRQGRGRRKRPGRYQHARSGRGSTDIPLDGGGPFPAARPGARLRRAVPFFCLAGRQGRGEGALHSRLRRGWRYSSGRGTAGGEGWREGEGAVPGEGSRKGGGAGGQWSLCVSAGVGRSRHRRRRRHHHGGETLRCCWPWPRSPGAESRQGPKPLPYSAPFPSPTRALGVSGTSGGRGRGRTGAGREGWVGADASACFEPVWR